MLSKTHSQTTHSLSPICCRRDAVTWRYERTKQNAIVNKNEVIAAQSGRYRKFASLNCDRGL